MSYHIRLDISSDHDLVYQLVENASCAAWVQEGTSNLHVHMYVETSTPIQTIRNWIRKAGLQGNKSYSVSLCKDKIKLLAYMLKEGNPVLYKNISQEDKDTALQYHENVKEEIKSKKPRNTLPAIMSLLQPVDSFPDKSYYYDHVKKVILKYHLDNELLLRRFQCQAYYDTIILRTMGMMYVDYIFRN